MLVHVHVELLIIIRHLSAMLHMKFQIYIKMEKTSDAKKMILQECCPAFDVLWLVNKKIHLNAFWYMHFVLCFHFVFIITICVESDFCKIYASQTMHCRLHYASDISFSTCLFIYLCYFISVICPCNMIYFRTYVTIIIHSSGFLCKKINLLGVKILQDLYIAAPAPMYFLGVKNPNV